MDEVTIANVSAYDSMMEFSSDEDRFKSKASKKLVSKSKSLTRIRKNKPEVKEKEKEKPRDREKESSNSHIKSKSKDVLIKSNDNITEEEVINETIKILMQTLFVSILNEEIAQLTEISNKNNAKENK